MRKEALEVLGPVVSPGGEAGLLLPRHEQQAHDARPGAGRESRKLHQQVAQLTDRTTSSCRTGDRKRAPARDDRLRAGLALRTAALPRHRAASRRTGGTRCRSTSAGRSTRRSTRNITASIRSPPTSRSSRRAASSARPAPSPRDVTDVILLVNENCNISATIQDQNGQTTHDQGIVQGQGNFERREAARHHQLPAEEFAGRTGHSSSSPADSAPISPPACASARSSTSRR